LERHLVSVFYDRDDGGGVLPAFKKATVIRVVDEPFEVKSVITTQADPDPGRAMPRLALLSADR